MNIGAEIVDQHDMRSKAQPTRGLSARDPLGASLNAAWQSQMERAQLEHWFKPFEPSAHPFLIHRPLWSLDNRNPALPRSAGSTASSGTTAKMWAGVHDLEGVLKTSRKTERPMVENCDLPVPRYEAPRDHAPEWSRNGGSDPAGEDDYELFTACGMYQCSVIPSAGTDYDQFAVLHEGVMGSGFSCPTPESPPAPVPTVSVERDSNIPAQFGLSHKTPVQSVTFPQDSVILPSTEVGDASHTVEAVSARGVDTNSGEGAALTASRRAAVQFSAEVPVRLHVQWFGQSAHIWLGMNGTKAQVDSQAMTVVDELRRHFAATGQKVGRVICNGRVVYDGQMTSGFGLSSSWEAASVIL
jgi:hypothetical protein